MAAANGDGATSGNGAIANGSHSHATLQQLVARLEEPRTAAALHSLLDNAELLAFSVSAVDGLIRRGDRITSNLAQSVSDIKSALPEDTSVYTQHVPRLVAQTPQLADLLERLLPLADSPEFQRTLTLLGKPETMRALNSLLQHSELLVFAVSAADAFVRRGDQITENVRDSLRDLSPSSSDLNSLLESVSRLLPYLPRLIAVAPQFIDIIERLAPFVASEEFDALLDSGVFHADTVRLIGQAGDAFVESYETVSKDDRKLGVFGALMALNDPELQRVLALLVAFGRRFGRAVGR
ncbi:MAG: DUF1641 domain-containing protein [Oscillochloris sp.]|nr:DUF1641 domain-containing protein [Oscillochloris sp.]